ncbi:unnamed protein product [Arabidopsis lyrata]|nr:unnamed protein product [Arabidopsis lyrata]
MDRPPSFPHYQIPNPNLFHHVPPPNPNPNFFVRPPLAHLQNPNNYSIAVSAADLRALRNFPSSYSCGVLSSIVGSKAIEPIELRRTWILVKRI